MNWINKVQNQHKNSNIHGVENNIKIKFYEQTYARQIL